MYHFLFFHPHFLFFILLNDLRIQLNVSLKCFTKQLYLLCFTLVSVNPLNCLTECIDTMQLEIMVTMLMTDSGLTEENSC